MENRGFVMAEQQGADRVNVRTSPPQKISALCQWYLGKVQQTKTFFRGVVGGTGYLKVCGYSLEIPKPFRWGTSK